MIRRARGNHKSDSSTDAATIDVTDADTDTNDQESRPIRRWCRICDDMFESSKNSTRCLRCTRHFKLFALDWPSRRLKRARKEDNQKITIKTDSFEDPIPRPVKKYRSDIIMDHHQISDRTDWTPYPLEGIDVKVIKYKRANGQVSHGK